MENCATTVLLISLVLMEVAARPRSETFNPMSEPTFLDTVRISCTAEIDSTCQRCAKHTKSPVVYPWCCTNHEGVREWCERYIMYGRP